MSLSLVVAGVCGSLFAAVRPSALFSDHAVLRRSSDTPVFGLAAPGEAVDVALGTVRAHGVAGKDGKWLVRLDLRAVGPGPFELTINGKTFKDVLVGEVWLCSGQSNMAFAERDADDIEIEGSLTNRQLRCFTVGCWVRAKPVDSVEGRWTVVRPENTPDMSAVGYHFAKYLQEGLKRPVGFVVAAAGAATIEAWCDPETMSVDPRGKAELDRQIAFMDGYRQYEERCDAERRSWEKSCGRLDRPHGSVPADGWKSLETDKAERFTHPAGAIWFKRDVAATPGKALVFARRRFIEQQWRFDMSSVEVYWNGRPLARHFSSDPIDKNTEYFDISPEAVRTTNSLVVRVFNAESIPNVLYGFILDRRKLPYDGWSLAEDFALPPLTEKEAKAMPPAQLFCLSQHYPAGLFNAKIAGLVPMGLSGVIWYQGESNACRAEAYEDLFRSLILSWRRLFGRDDLPFVWCQLASYMAKASDPKGECTEWAQLRESQDRVLALPMTGQAVLIDVGEAWDIHPRDKRTPGSRLAVWALSRVYGRADIPCHGPRFDGVETRGSALFVRLRDVAGGLVAHDLGTNYISCSAQKRMGTLKRNSPKAQVEGFSIAGADGVWHWADEATIGGDGVLVSSKAVPQPRAVRYGWSSNPMVNLYNTDGFPAVPFGTRKAPLKVLMLGNSFSLSCMTYLPEVARSCGCELDLASLYDGGCSFEGHWNHFQALTTNRTSRPYRYSRNVCGRAINYDGQDAKKCAYYTNAVDVLKSEKWDIVTVQQASWLAGRMETYLPFADKVIAKIRELAPDAEIVVQETWAYSDHTKGQPGLVSRVDDYRKLRRTYGDFAAARNLRLIPMGSAVQLFRERLPVVNTETSFGGDLMGQGEFSKDDRGRWFPTGDCVHLNSDGEYFQALVWTGFLFDADVTKCAFVPAGMPSVRAQSMQRIVREALSGEVPKCLSEGHVTSALWPGDAQSELKAQPSSTMTVRRGLAEVATGTEYPWPGVRLDFKGMRDLSSYGTIVVGVTNMADRALKLQLSVKGKNLQGRSPEGELQLMPQAAGQLVVILNPMPWKLDGPMDFVGMNGFPQADDGSGHLFDIAKTTSLHLFRVGKAEPAHFGITEISVGGTPAGRQKVLDAKTFLPFVDRFGQFSHDDWPGKVHDESDLERSRRAETTWLAAHPESPIPDVDRFGGWAGGPQLKATGFFRTEKVNGKWWFVDPDGHLFFSHGVDHLWPGECITAIGFRERYFEWIPAKDDPAFGCFWHVQRNRAAHGFYSQEGHYPYSTFDFGGANMVRKYGEGWRKLSADLTHRRLRAWGLNTIGNWSQPEVYNLRRTPYTLRTGTWGTPRRAGSKGWWGPLPDPFNPEFERIFRARVRESALVMGNDPWCLGVFVDNELSWDNLPDVVEVAEKYFSVVSSVLHEELPNHLYLGCRIAWGSDAVYRAAARYCDVVSVNMYDRRPMRDLPKGCVDKPMINGEFHCGALDRGMFHTGLIATGSQRERAQCYRDFVNGCLDHPRMIGTHWFQWCDQALTGRDDGENYQIGFVTVTDAPYPELVEAARDVATGMYWRRFGKEELR